MLGKPIFLSKTYIDLPLSFEEVARVAALAPPEPKRERSHSSSRKKGGKSVLERARNYLAEIDPAIMGANGSSPTFRAACILIVDFDLSIDEARPLMHEYSERCQPPWDESDIEHKLEDADEKTGERGRLLKESVAPKIDNHESTFEPFEILDIDKPVEAEKPTELIDVILPSADDGMPEIPTLDAHQSIAAVVNQEISPPKRLGEPVRNFSPVMGDNGKVINVPLPITVIAERALRETGNWPRRVGRALFSPCVKGDGVDWIDSSAALFAYLGYETGRPPEILESSSTAHYQSRTEIFKFFTTAAKSYLAVETQPHEPQMEDHYYACKIPEPGDGSALNKLVDFFNPDTEIDRDLIIAMFATPFWGGEGGTRPAFCITSEDGRGAGKSKLATFVSDVAGGMVEISNGEDMPTVKQRFLSPEGLSKRVALLDNVKSLRFSWAELEALITSPTISGKRMYVGEATRPNSMTFIITLNGVSLSTDLAQRCVVIKVKKPVYYGTWTEDVSRYIKENHKAIVADCIGFLRQPAHEISQFSRWGAWEQHVLSRLPEPSEAAAIIRERQVASDVESEESDLIEEGFCKKLQELNYDTKTARVFIPVGVAAKWFAEATGEKGLTVMKASRSIRQKIDEGGFKRIQEYPTRSYGRGFVWWGIDATGESEMRTDLEHQIEISRRNTFD